MSDKLKKHTSEIKKRRNSKEEERSGGQKKAMVALLVFLMATLEIRFLGRKNAIRRKVYLGVTFGKNPAGYI